MASGKTAVGSLDGRVWMMTSDGRGRMDAGRFTAKVQEALSGAQDTVIRFSHQQVDVEHLLIALLGQEQGLVPAIIQKARIDIVGVKRRVEQEPDRLPKISTPSGPPEQLYITGRLNRLLVQADDEAKQLKDDYHVRHAREGVPRLR